MFAAALPQPSHQLPGSALATGIRDAILAANWASHCREHYSQGDALKTKRIPQPLKSQEQPQTDAAKPKRAGRRPTRKVAMQTVTTAPAPAAAGRLPAELLPAADAICLILGLEPMARPAEPQAPTRPTSKPTLGIAADALARIRVDEASDAWCAVAQSIPKKKAARVKARARAWAKWEGTAGALVGR